ncbi:DNA repair protein REV1-like [Liolophura sinensis]|uniref:DNA repair protein REV1-like n=1 Tax=Liolophura sinensis TaxID=3198878 RepID=UPI003159244D
MFPQGNQMPSAAGSCNSTSVHQGVPKDKSRDKTKRRGHDLGNGFEEWGGYMNAKKQKLADQFSCNRPRDETSSDIFKGVSIYVNGYTNPSSDKLKHLMNIHGGNYEHYLSKTRVTHVIATRLPNSKVKELKGKDKVVKPEWILDSIQAGRLLSYEPYQLYTAQSSVQKGISKFATVVTSPVADSSRASSLATERHPSRASSEGIEQLDREPERYDNQIELETSPTLFSPSFEEQIENHSDEEHSYHSEVVVSDLTVSESAHKSFTSDITQSDNQTVDSERHLTKGEAIKKYAKDGVNYHGATRTIATAGDSTFVSEFYQHSRLHHLSTWKAEFAEYVNHLQVSGNGTYPGRKKLVTLQAEKSSRMLPREITLPSSKGKPQRVIMHVDMDCFFVSVGLRERPELKGKPIAVTHSKGKGTKLQPGANRQLEKALWEQGRSKRARGKANSKVSLPEQSCEDEGTAPADSAAANADVRAILTSCAASESSEEFYSMAEIASCSYEARQAGVKNGMFMGGAKKLCPDLVTIPYDFDKYNEVSRQLYDIVASYTHDIEAVSCDEMLVDCTDLLADVGVSPLDFASALRQEIQEKTGCSASVGMGPNILLAKMATRNAKPNGQFYLGPDQVTEFIGPKLVKDLPGIGWAINKRLTGMGIERCADMQKVPLANLQKEFGPKLGQSLYRNCRGQDDRPIKVERERKSVSAEINYGIRFKQDSDAVKFLGELAEEVHNRLEKTHSKGKSITLKLKVRREDAPVETAKFLGHGICNQITKSATLPLATDNTQIIAKEVITILKGLKVSAADIRGIGIQMQKLEPASIRRSGLNGHQSILGFTVPKSAVQETKISPIAQRKSNTVAHESGSSSHKAVHESNSDLHDSLDDSHTWRDSHKSSSDSHNTEDSNKSVGDSSLPLIDSPELEAVTTQESAARVTSTRLFLPGQMVEPPLPRLPSLNSPEFGSSPVMILNTPVRRDVDLNAVEDYLPSPSQVDPEVMKELPADIRVQIEAAMKQRRGTKQMPPVKQTPQSVVTAEDTPGCSHWPSQEPLVVTTVPEESINVDVNSTSETLTPKVYNKTIALPSPSQIDPEVMKELPVDIREQIETAIKQRRDTKGRASVNQPQQQISEHQRSHGSSDWSGQNPSSEIIVTNNLVGSDGGNHGDRNTSHLRARACNKIEPLPSFSQLDMDCLNALPPDLRKEIQQAYAVQEKQNTARNSPSKMSSWASVMSAAKSPSKSPNKKGKSPNRNKRKSPQFKVPQGKPGRRKKQSSKKLDFTRSVEEKIPLYSDSEEVQIVEALSNAKPETSEVSVTETQVTLESREATHVNLCGRVALADVKDLLRQWIQSCQAPEDEDVRVIVQYLGELVLDKNLEHVDLLLKFLRRLVRPLSAGGWSEAFLNIVTNTQDIIFSQHGSRLKEFNHQIEHS